MGTPPPDAPGRRGSDRYPGVPAELVATIENGVKLDTLISDMKQVKERQESNHLVALALKEHNTIAKTNELWTGFGEIKFLLRVILGLIALVPIVIGILTFTHYVLHWPA